MKKLNVLLMALGGALILSLGSCKDECKDVTCENGGTCDEGDCVCTDNYYGESCEDKCVNGSYGSGTCDCQDGYEGESCETVWSDKFVGNYSVNDDCVGSAYNSAVSTSSTDGEINILISDFGSYLCNSEAPTVKAKLTNGTDLVIEQQTFCPGASEFTIQGTGSINSSESVITVSYSGTDPNGSPYSCTATMTKQ